MLSSNYKKMIDTTFLILSGWEIYQFEGAIFAQNISKNITINCRSILDMSTDFSKSYMASKVTRLNMHEMPNWLMKSIQEYYETIYN